MALFGAKKEKKAEAPKGAILGFTKSKKFLFFKLRSKPIYAPGQAPAMTPPAQQSAPLAAKPAQQVQQASPRPLFGGRPQPVRAPQDVRIRQPKPLQPKIPTTKRPNPLQIYWVNVAGKHKELDVALRSQKMKESPYEFVRKMFVYAVLFSAVVAVASSVLLISYGLTPLLGIVLGVACYSALFGKFIRYPIDRSVVVGKDIEKDILFAARDLVISMRSGMPLFNAITAVSTGYGSASLEFAKIVELVQLGSPIEDALEEVRMKSQSRTFKRIMLQATVSLKAGADVVGALQGVVEEVQQERVIELRRYGQRLNALAMFYMLFGVIFPSMGIAVAAILTTFINIFTVDETTLIFALVFICFLQVIFLNIMRSSRPTFAM